MTLPARLTDLSLDAIVTLFTLDTTPCHTMNGVQVTQGQVFNWTPGTLGDAPVYFGGVEYLPMAINGTDYEWTGQGTPPMPKLQVQNLGGIIAGLTMTLDDLVGAKVTRTRTFKKHLDGQPEADPNTYFEPDEFYINRKSLHDKNSIEFELATPFEELNRQIPATIVMRNSCRHSYRQFVNGQWIYGTCPYAGSAMFDGSNNPVTSQGQDVCSRRLSGCLARFGQKAPLPIKAFPGAGQTGN